MGMDVYGKKPVNPTGEYFRANVWSWHPIADLTLALGPEKITNKCKHWHSNDGDGLEAKDALALGLILQKAINAGTVEKWIDKNDSEQTRYTVTLEHVQEWVDFLHTCGGFKIH